MKSYLAWLVARPIAHRGLHDKAKGVIENTASAALAAIEAKYAIECDVQITSDGEAVVFHDFVLDRLTEGSGRLDKLRAEALRVFAMRGTTDRVMRLADWLQFVAGRTVVVIEIKSDFTGDMRLLHRVIEVMKGYEGPFALKSFDPLVLEKLREAAPAIARGIVAMNDYDHSDYRLLSNQEKHALANLLHFSGRNRISCPGNRGPAVGRPYLCRTQLGMPVMAWTVRKAEERERARLDADQMVFEGFKA